MQFKLTLIAEVVFTILYIVAYVLLFSSSSEVSWKQVDEVLWLLQAITHVGLAVLIIHEKRFEAVKYPLSDWVYWIANFSVILLFTVSAVICLVSVDVDGTKGFKVDEVVSFISFPLSLFLVVVAVKGSNGIVLSEESQETQQHLVDDKMTESEVTDFASASLLSKAFWIWINPLLRKGYKFALKID